MNRQIVIYVIGKIMKLEALFMLMALCVSFYYKESMTLKFSFIAPIIFLFLIGTIITRKPLKNSSLFAKEGFLIVSLSWILLSIFGALPFFISGEIPNYVDAFFETVSGFTTTGSTILTEIESMSKSLLYWRSFTNFIGGMGVLVFAMAVLPKVNNQTANLMKAESPGPSYGKVVPKMIYNSRILYLIYIFMTIILIFILFMQGMPFFDAINHSLTAAGTGGFGIKNDSIAFYNSYSIYYTLAIATLIFSVNFNLYYFFLIGNIKQIFKNEEFKAFLVIVLVACILMGLDMRHMYSDLSKLCIDVFFTVSSTITTTGFSIISFGTLPTLSTVIIFILMFIGGCAGSTAGGFKVSRFLIIIKNFKAEIKKIGTPKRKVAIKINEKPIPETIYKDVINYFSIYIFSFFLILLIVSITTPDFLTAFSSVMSTFNNVGPGFGMTVDNFSEMVLINKIVLSFSMLLGRLEIIPMLIFFSPAIYKKDKK